MSRVRKTTWNWSGSGEKAWFFFHFKKAFRDRLTQNNFLAIKNVNLGTKLTQLQQYIYDNTYFPNISN
jgi:hypothetical protein